MSSEAITQNDLREILSRTVGSIPSEYKKLLWTNPNPSTQFSAQTLSIDLTNFDAVEVTFKHYYSGDTPQATAIAEKNVNAICAIPTNSNRSLPRRNFKATNTGVTFGSGSGFDDTYTWYAQNDGWAIPQKIYGIKYERVYLPQLVITSGCELIKGSTGISTSGTTIYFDNTLDDYDFVLIGASWGVGGVVTGYLYVPVVWWTGTTDVIKVYLNNNPSNDSLTIGNRDNSKATISSSNANVACQVMGIKL